MEVSNCLIAKWVWTHALVRDGGQLASQVNEGLRAADSATKVLCPFQEADVLFDKAPLEPILHDIKDSAGIFSLML
jgi:hypothetical protein